MSVDFALRCNEIACRVELTGDAVVTTCSHIFCLPCANSSCFSRNGSDHRICPACKSQLDKQDDCIVTNLKPSEDYKTSVLSGLSPSIIIDCTSRALAFYSYQAIQEITYQYSVNTMLKDKNTRKTNELATYAMQASSELQRLRDLLETKQKALTGLENKHRDMVDAFRDKGKALQETQAKYQALKSRSMSIEQQFAASDEAEQALQGTFSRVYNPNLPRPSSAGLFNTAPFQTRIPRANPSNLRQSISRAPENGRFPPIALVQYHLNFKGPMFSGNTSASGTRLPVLSSLHMQNDRRYTMSEDGQYPSNETPFIGHDVVTEGQRHSQRRGSIITPSVSNRTKLDTPMHRNSQYHFRAPSRNI